MDDAMRELGRRAIAAGWRWMPGAHAGTPGSKGGTSHFVRIERIRDDGLPWCLNRNHGFVPLEYVAGSSPIPNLSDPSTLGCLLAQVRERWGDPCIYAHCDDDDDHDGAGVFWTVDSPRWTRVRTYAECPFHPTEAAALVAALEAAPKVAP